MGSESQPIQDMAQQFKDSLQSAKTVAVDAIVGVSVAVLVIWGVLSLMKRK